MGGGPFGPDPAESGPELYIQGRLVGLRPFGPDPAESGSEPYIKWFMSHKPLYIWPGTIYKMVYVT